MTFHAQPPFNANAGGSHTADRAGRVHWSWACWVAVLGAGRVDWLRARVPAVRPPGACIGHRRCGRRGWGPGACIGHGRGCQQLGHRARGLVAGVLAGSVRDRARALVTGAGASSQATGRVHWLLALVHADARPPGARIGHGRGCWRVFGTGRVHWLLACVQAGVDQRARGLGAGQSGGMLGGLLNGCLWRKAMCQPCAGRRNGIDAEKWWQSATGYAS